MCEVLRQNIFFPNCRGRVKEKARLELAGLWTSFLFLSIAWNAAQVTSQPGQQVMASLCKGKHALCSKPAEAMLRDDLGMQMRSSAYLNNNIPIDPVKGPAAAVKRLSMTAELHQELN